MGLSVWHCNSRCLAILVDAAGGNDGSDRVVVSQCVAQRLQDNHTTSFPAAETSPSVVKRNRSPGVRKQSVVGGHFVSIAPECWLGNIANRVTYLQVEKEIQNSGSMLRWQPPTRAALDSPVRKLWQARCKATILDEHAVSDVKLGPLKSKKCEILLDCIAYAQPALRSALGNFSRMEGWTNLLPGAWGLSRSP